MLLVCDDSLSTCGRIALNSSFFLAQIEKFNCKGNTNYNQPGRAIIALNSGNENVRILALGSGP